MKEKLFDLIVKIESANPNDFEFGNAVRTVLLIADKGKEDIEIDHARGIALGDVITRIDDEVIDNEDDLLNALENRRAGDVVSVTTQRDTETLTYQIELQASQAQ